MPARLKIKILCCKNLPVMDKSSEKTDGFVEIKIGKAEAKTEVCRHSLNPIFNSEWYKFEIPDEELQDECLQIRVMDYDRYSSDDQIGKIYVNLIPLLFKECGHQMNGFFPIYDTMSGVRGQLYCAIKMEPFSDSNKFRQTSCGIRFFFSPIVPFGYYATTILGFVEELVVNDDPEYQWIDKIRTPRASNEARQLLFNKLSNEVQRKLGSKALELGGNAVVGYQLYYDLENSSICVRGIGTAIILKKIAKRADLNANINNQVQVIARQHTTSLSMPPNESNQIKNVQRSISNSESLEESEILLAHPIDDQAQQQQQSNNNLTTSQVQIKKTSPIPINSYKQSSSDLDLDSPTPKLNSIGSNIINLNLDDLNTTHTPDYKFVNELPIGFYSIEYPFITMKQFPHSFIKSIGGVVSSRSVKHLAMLNSQEDLMTESRESWLMELRKEIRNHCRMLDCDAVLGYSETITIHDDVCILSASGTAAVLNSKSSLKSNSIDNLNDYNSPNNLNKVFDLDPKNQDRNSSPKLNKPNCTLCHIPYADKSDKSSIFGSSLPKCRFCLKNYVPECIFATIEPPFNLPTIGTGCLIQARVFRNKKDTRAKELSDSLPFLEYELHKQLLSKLKLHNMNAIFNLNIQLSVGESTLIALATGTGLFLSPLTEPNPIRVKGSGKSIRMKDRINDIQKIILDLVENNKERYGLVNINNQLNSLINQQQSNELTIDQLDSIALDGTKTAVEILASNNQQIIATKKPSSEQCIVLEVDDGDDSDITLLLDKEVPKNFEICNTDFLPGEQFLPIYQTFNKVYRSKITNPKQFSAQFDWIIQSLFVKLRRLTPCCLAGLKFKVDAGADDNVIQISIIGTVVGIRNLNQSLASQNGLSLCLPTHCYQDKKAKISNDNEFVFENDEENCEKLDLPSAITSVSQLQNRGNPASVELTTLSYLPKCKIVKYISNLCFPYIREVTSIRECGGLNGFLTSFLNELLLIVRSHIVSLDGNALISMNITQLVLLHNPHKNQAQCLIIITGDVVSYDRIDNQEN